MKYQMHYLSGGGTVYDGGVWDVRETPKLVTFEQVEEPFFDSNCPHKMRLPKSNRSPHCLKLVDDEYVVYPFRNGKPHIFAPLSKPPSTEHSKDCCSHPDSKHYHQPCSCNTNWETRFDKQFESIFGHGGEEDVKDFIRKLIAEERDDRTKNPQTDL